MSNDDELLTVEQVAELLKLGRTTIYDLIGKGDLPALKFGRACRIERAAVAALIARKREETTDA